LKLLKTLIDASQSAFPAEDGGRKPEAHQLPVQVQQAPQQVSLAQRQGSLHGVQLGRPGGGAIHPASHQFPTATAGFTPHTVGVGSGPQVVGRFVAAATVTGQQQHQQQQQGAHPVMHFVPQGATIPHVIRAQQQPPPGKRGTSNLFLSETLRQDLLNRVSQTIPQPPEGMCCVHALFVRVRELADTFLLQMRRKRPSQWASITL
jgi:hypothetical protein